MPSIFTWLLSPFIERSYVNQHKDGRAARLQRITDLFHEVIVDSEIPSLGRQTTKQGRHQTPKERAAKDQSDQEAREIALTCGHSGVLPFQRLFDLHFAILVFAS